MNRIYFFFVLCALTFIFLGISSAFAACVNCPIDATDRLAWNDVIGWIDFQYDGNPNVTVSSTELKGYASSSVGYLQLNCATFPTGDSDTCSFGGWKVTNDGGGNLAGWAWNDNIGWVSFSCDHMSDGTVPAVTTCGNANYGVTIDPSGDFHGWAWNDVVGWISFNASESGSSVPYKVKTSWTLVLPSSAELISNIFDTCPVSFGLGNCGTAALNTALWHGALNGGQVRFQFAASDDPMGPWVYIGDTGAQGSYFGPVNPNTVLKLKNLNNKRYFRYKIFLYPDSGATQSPIVDDIIVNWSP